MADYYRMIAVHGHYIQLFAVWAHIQVPWQEMHLGIWQRSSRNVRTYHPAGQEIQIIFHCIEQQVVNEHFCTELKKFVVTPYETLWDHNRV